MNKLQTNSNVKTQTWGSSSSGGKVCLKDVAEIRSGYSFRSALEEVEDGVPVVQIRDLTLEGRIDPESVIRVPDEGFKDRHFVKPGEVLFAARGAQRSAAVVEGAFGAMVAGSQFLVLTVREPNKVLPDYLAWLLGTEGVRRRLDAMAAGATIPLVSIAMLKRLEVEIPSVAAQRRLLEMREAAEKKYPGKPELVERFMTRQRFVLPQGSEFASLFAKRNDANIGEEIDVALEAIEEANKAKLEGVFRNIRFNSESNLGETKDRNKRLKNLLEDFADPRLDLRPSVVGDADVIGDVYEYLIARFASDSGKKGGEFYTPKSVATLLARLLKPAKGAKICDPACGSGSLLIRVANEVPDPDDYALYGQESNGSTWALCRMNMFLHGKDSADIKWGDTLNNPKLLVNDALMKFDVVVANPPFSLDKWGAEEASSDLYKRYHRGVPPKSKGDFAFISHMVETSVEGKGRVGVIVPHGVLFRGGAEGRIRKAMIEENLLECMIGLPANLFFGTGIPAAILIFNRAKTTRDVLFIDASKQFEKGTNQNLLRTEDLDRIVATQEAFESVDKYAARVTFAEIEENEFNLNIPRYVDTFEEEEEIDIPAVQNRIEALESELAEVRETMKVYLVDLGLVEK